MQTTISKLLAKLGNAPAALVKSLTLKAPDAESGFQLGIKSTKDYSRQWVTNDPWAYGPEELEAEGWTIDWNWEGTRWASLHRSSKSAETRANTYAEQGFEVALLDVRYGCQLRWIVLVKF